MGLPVVSENHFRVCQTIDEIIAFAHDVERIRSTLVFDIDGMVIKVNLLQYHDQLGTTAKSPRWATAYKFAPEQVETVLEEITVQVGRTGVLTPVAQLKPVSVAGSVIARATLHNEEEIFRKDVRQGDTVIIEKGGDIIPKVLGVVMTKRPSHTLAWTMPTRCPICKTHVVRKEGEVAVRCPNGTKCHGTKSASTFVFCE